MNDGSGIEEGGGGRKGGGVFMIWKERCCGLYACSYSYSYSLSRKKVEMDL